MSNPRVSLLMPNRDNAPVLDLVLDRLAANTRYPNVELLVVDDGSTDGSLEILRRWRDSGALPELELIEREHSGVVDALNAGLEAATGELVVQLDGDASMETPGWLGRMVDFFVSDERIGVVTGKIVFDWGEIHTCGVDMIAPEGFHDRGAAITEPVGRRTYHQRIERRREDDCATCDSIAEVDGGIGCCMMYRRDVALGIGGYDPGWAPVWFDDLDLTMCIRREGLKVFYLPDVRVVHHVGRRLEDESSLKRDSVTVRRRIGAQLPPKRQAPHLVRRSTSTAPAGTSGSASQHHYAYWREKWGFDILNPDMDAVLERWGDTEVCWRYDPGDARGGRADRGRPPSGLTRMTVSVDGRPLDLEELRRQGIGRYAPRPARRAAAGGRGARRRGGPVRPPACARRPRRAGEPSCCHHALSLYGHHSLLYGPQAAARGHDARRRAAPVARRLPAHRSSPPRPLPRRAPRRRHDLPVARPRATTWPRHLRPRSRRGCTWCPRGSTAGFRPVDSPLGRSTAPTCSTWAGWWSGTRARTWRG